MYYVVMKGERPTLVTEDKNVAFDALDNRENGVTGIRTADTLRDVLNLHDEHAEKTTANQSEQPSSSQTSDELVKSVLNGLAKGIEAVVTEMAKDATVKKVVDGIESIFNPPKEK